MCVDLDEEELQLCCAYLLERPLRNRDTIVDRPRLLFTSVHINKSTQSHVKEGPSRTAHGNVDGASAVRYVTDMCTSVGRGGPGVAAPRATATPEAPRGGFFS